jgi:hypothetical protein
VVVAGGKGLRNDGLRLVHNDHGCRATRVHGRFDVLQLGYLRTFLNMYVHKSREGDVISK